MAAKRLCSILECGKPHKGRGYCNGHLKRLAKHGDPLGGRENTGAAWGEAQAYLRDVVLKYDGDSCLTWPYSVRSDGRAQMFHVDQPALVHRLVCEAEHGPPPTNEHEASHNCGNGHLACVAKRHLQWKLKRENHADKKRHGTHGWKLTEHEVQRIRELEGKLSLQTLADIFEVDSSHISLIHRRQVWAHLL